VTRGSSGRRDAGDARSSLPGDGPKRQNEPPNGNIAVEELSICPVENLNSDEEGEPPSVNGRPEALRNHWPPLTHPPEALSAVRR
jgi:hypothetical protein